MGPPSVADYVVRMLLALLACTPKAPLAEPALAPPPEGLDFAQLPLIRAAPGAAKIYVEATLQDGSTGLFLVDTGASVTAIDQETADRLGLVTDDPVGVIQGFGGQAAWHRAELDYLSLGGVVVQDVEVAVGLPGVPRYTGAIEVDGILGNNVWGNFVVAVDYPGDMLEIGVPGTVEIPESAVPMAFDGSHVHTLVRLVSADETGHESARDLLLEIDTGARRILLSGVSGSGLEAIATEGEEPIFGLGASEKMPVSAFYRQTRHVNLVRAELGGTVLEDPGHATWINYQDDMPIGPVLAGLVGHHLLAEHRVVFDYPGGRFAMTDSILEPKQVDGHQFMLDRELSEHPEDDDRALLRARYRAALEDVDGAIADVDTYLGVHAGDVEASVIRARLMRYQGDLAGYAALMAEVPAADLVDQGELIAMVNGLLLEQQQAEALRLAEEALVERPEESASHVALADARLGNDDPTGARKALAEAARLEENPDAYLKRRARIALAEGDAFAALAHLRTRLALYPSDGEALWFYAMLVSEFEALDAESTFQRDADAAMARLHPESQPLDFLMASLALVGVDTDGLHDQGVDRDCEAIEEGPGRNNCMAWYAAMSGVDDDASLELIEAAVAEEANRSDYLDTLAMVHLARGELEAAADAALLAARITPDRFYHLWQAERIAQLAAAVSPAEQP